MKDTQLLKGILEGCVLAVIARGETYGYAILTEMEQVGFDELGEGTLYPVITRLDKNGYILCRKSKSPLGPVRKYYTITDEGIMYLQNFKDSYKRISDSADKILFSKTNLGANHKEGE